MNFCCKVAILGFLKQSSFSFLFFTLTIDLQTESELPASLVSVILLAPWAANGVERELHLEQLKKKVSKCTARTQMQKI